MDKSKTPSHALENDQKSRAETETSLARTNEIFSLLVDAVEDYAIFALDLEGNILTWNLGGQRLKGYLPHEVIGQNFTKFYTEVDIQRKHPQYELEQALKFGKYEEEGWRLRKDGQRFWANVVITALRDRNGIARGFGKVTRDLTARRNAEMHLKASEERFRLMIEGVRDYAIFMLDPKGFVATWNAGAEFNKGYTASEIIGRHFSTFYPQEDLDAGKPARELEVAVATGRYEDEGWRVRKDGGKFWANVVITAIRDDAGKLLGFSKVTRNLTERKKAEDELRRAYGELEELVAERTKELTLAKGRAESAVSSRDRFFSIASHELKTPLTSLKLQAQLRKRSVLKGDYSDFAPENLVELCEDDDRQVSRLAVLVDNMLDISKISSGNFKLVLEEVDLAELTKNCIAQIKPLLATSGNACTMHTSGKVEGCWDPHRLEQVIINILANVSKYAPGKPVEVTVVGDDKTVRVAIKDYGQGISVKDQTRIFQPFERVQGLEAEGLGLGLYISEQIVSLHGGHLSVESALGQGSTFIIELPYRPPSTGD